MKRSVDLEKEAVLDVARLMIAAARTAPKTCGIDNIVIALIDDGPDIKKLAKAMRDIGTARKRPSMERDALSIGSSPAVVVIGVKSNPAGLDCGFCGYDSCKALEKSGGICACNSLDLGIAVSSAISIASHLHIDNRVMYSVGKAVLRLGFFGANVRQVLGVPLSVSGKNPFFDRK